MCGTVLRQAISPKSTASRRLTTVMFRALPSMISDSGYRPPSFRPCQYMSWRGPGTWEMTTLPRVLSGLRRSTLFSAPGIIMVAA